jgi:membrane dipeptidase
MPPVRKVVTAVLLLPFVAASVSGCSRQLSEEQIQAMAPRIHDEAWVVDTHVDAPGAHVRDQTWLASERHESGVRGSGQWDIPRMIEGGEDAIWLVAYVGQGDLTPEAFENAYQRALPQFDWSRRMADSSPLAEIALTSEDAVRLHEAGRRALFIGVENGYPIGMDLGKIREFYDLGMRYMTLSHNGDNQICASTNPRDREREDFGLTDFGRQVVAELNRLGVIADVSHISDQSFFDLVEVSRAPVVATHSGVRALGQNSRDMTDEMLLALKENGGVIQLVALGSFLRPTPEIPGRNEAMQALQAEFPDRRSLSPEQMQAYRARMTEINEQFPIPPVTIENFMQHLDHAVALIGIDHVGFGSDFDGGGGIQGIDDVTALPNITVEMLRRGYSERDIKKFWGGNFLRVMREVEQIADR